MKKLLVLVLVLALCLPCLVACTQTQPEVQGTEGKPSGGLENPTSAETNEENKDYSEIYKDPYDVYEELTNRGYTGTFEEWVASLTGKDGEDGADGADGKSAYELAVEKGYEGTLEEWLHSLVGAAGEDGKDGKDGKSVFELAVENGFKGTLAEWLESLVGAKGDKGDKGETGAQGVQGVGVVNAYVDENLHLWIVLSDGAKIDAGYVGVTTTEPTPTTYTVTFVDYNGSELKKEIVESGKTATAPADPVRNGFTFIGWDKAFDNVTGDLTITAQYESASPQISVSQATAKAGDTNVTVAITIKNNPGVIGASFEVAYDSALSLTSVTKGDAWSSLSFTKSGVLTSPCSFGWDGLDADDASNGVLLILTFDVSTSAADGRHNILISYNNGDIFDCEFNPVVFEIVQGAIVVE